MRRALGCAILVTLGFAVSACDGESGRGEESPAPSPGSFAADLVAGGGSSLSGAEAVNRLLQVPVDENAEFTPVQFDIATDDSVWVATLSSGAKQSAASGNSGHFPNSLVRIDSAGSAVDVDFNFIDSARLDGGSAEDSIAVLSGPVSDGVGGVVVVVGPEPARSGRTPAWSKLYRVDSDGEVGLVDVPELYVPVSVGPSQAGGYLVSAVHSEFRPCQRVFRHDEESAQWIPVIGRDCVSQAYVHPGLGDLVTQPSAPLDVQLQYDGRRGLRAGLLPDGRVVLLDAAEGLFVEDGGILRLAVTDAPRADEGSGASTPQPLPSWSSLSARAPFVPFGMASDLRSYDARFSLTPDGQIALLLDAVDTPAMNSRAFHFDIGGVPGGNAATSMAAQGIREHTYQPVHVPGPAEADEVRGSGVALFDAIPGTEASGWPASLVSGYGQPCQWRADNTMICAVTGFAPGPNGTVPSVVLVAVDAPST